MCAAAITVFDRLQSFDYRRRLQPASSLLTAYSSSSVCWLDRAIQLVPYLGRDRASVTKRGAVH